MKKRTKSPDIPFNTAFKGMWLHQDPAEHSSKSFKENPITAPCLTAFPFKELPTAKPMGTGAQAERPRLRNPSHTHFPQIGPWNNFAVSLE